MKIPFGLRSTSFALPLFALFTVAFTAVGCGSKPDDAAAGASSATATPGTGNVPANSRGEEEGVFRYNGETNEGGATHATMKNVTLHKAADNGSEVVGTVGKGTFVNKKARLGAFTLVEFPFGAPGQLKKGWLENTKITPNTVAVTSTTAVPVLPTAPTTPTATATTTATGTGKVPIIKPPIKRP